MQVRRDHADGIAAVGVNPILPGYIPITLGNNSTSDMQYSLMQCFFGPPQTTKVSKVDRLLPLARTPPRGHHFFSVKVSCWGCGETVNAMKAHLWWQRMYRAARWNVAKSAIFCLSTGTVLGLAAVLLSGFNRVSPQQAVAMALPALMLTIGGMLWILVPDSWTAWRRGFRQGCQVGMRVQLQDSEPDIQVLQGRS